MASTNMATKQRPRAALMKPVAVRLPSPPTEGSSKLPELEVHLFNERRQHLGTAPVRQGKAELDAPVTRSRLVRAIVAPQGMQPQAVLASKSLPSISMETRSLKTLELPHGWWENLLFGQLIFYRGHVEKVIGNSTLPICEGTVEVYEVDPFQWIWVLPELELARIRDDLLVRLAMPIPRRPGEPRVPPIPAPPGPVNAAPGLRAGDGFAHRAAMGGTGGHGGIGGRIELSPQAMRERATSTAAYAFDTGLLARLEGDGLRNYLFLNRYQLLPILCLLEPSWWYRKDKIGEVPIQPDGTFFGFAGWWLPGQDRPDLYFRVRQTINGVERVIYAPAVSCSTWWDYSGQDVPLLVTDPAAVCCSDPVVAQDNQIVYLGIGFDTTTDVAGAEGLMQTGTNVGLYSYVNGKVGPFGGALHIVLDVDLEGLHAAGVRYYRFSYRRGQQNAIGNPSAWTPLATPISRHYRVVTGGVVSYPALSLVPAPGTLPAALAGQEGILAFPEPGRDYVVIEASDRAFGIWGTEDLATGGQTQGDVADVYTVRLEVFNAMGDNINSETPILRIHEHEPDDTYTTTPLDTARPFLFVHVDNRPMVAEISNVIEAGSTSTGTGCGFLIAQPNAQVEVGVKAYHPGGLGFAGDPDRFLDSWSYVISRGATALTMVNYTVTDTNVGDDANFYDLPNGNVPLQTVDALLSGLTGGGTPDSPRRCTFNVRLQVNALTRNGYGVLGGFNRSDSASFALIDRSQA